MNLIGKFLEKLIMITKYDNIEVSNDNFNANIIRLTNQLWKLIPMKENNEDWEKQLNTVIIEIVGLGEVIKLASSPLFLQLVSKLEGIKEKKDIPFHLYRKTVFETINLIQELKIK